MLPLSKKEERKSQFHSKFYRMDKKQVENYLSKLRAILVSLPEHDITVRVYLPDLDFYEDSTKISICINSAGELHLIKHLDRRNEFILGDDVLVFLQSHYFAYSKEQIENRKKKLEKLLIKK